LTAEVVAAAVRTAAPWAGQHTDPERPAVRELPTQKELDRSTAPTILRALTTRKRPLTHEALDKLSAGKPVEHMIRLQRWTTSIIAERADPTWLANPETTHRVDSGTSSAGRVSRS
jgi:hypothetical protein